MGYLEKHQWSGLKVGDTVRVTRKAKDGEGGWENSWSKSMNNSIGKTFKILNDNEVSGFCLNDEYSLDYPYYCLQLVTDVNTASPCEDPNIDSIPIGTIIDKLRFMFPNGHDQFIPITLDEIKLHSQKNHDYAHGGKATGNFDRVSKIKKLYPGLDWTTPAATAIDYMLKQLDAGMWMLAMGYTAKVESADDRWQDVSVYAKLIRILMKEGL